MGGWFVACVLVELCVELCVRSRGMWWRAGVASFDVTLAEKNWQKRTGPTTRTGAEVEDQPGLCVASCNSDKVLWASFQVRVPPLISAPADVVDVENTSKLCKTLPYP